MTTITQTITDLSTPPSKSDPTNFDTRADTFLSELDTLATQVNTWAAQCNTVAGDVDANATTASTAAVQAISAANAESWVSYSASLHDIRISPADDKFYINTTGAGGTTDPSADATNWDQIGAMDSTAINMSDNLLTRAILKDTAEELSAIGNTGAAQTFDCTVANVFTATLDQNCTFTFSNPPASGDAGFMFIEGTNFGAFTITWPASVDWERGTAPALTAAGVDLLGFYTRDAGTTWHGMVLSTDTK